MRNLPKIFLRSFENEAPGVKLHIENTCIIKSEWYQFVVIGGVLWLVDCEWLRMLFLVNN